MGELKRQLDDVHDLERWHIIRGFCYGSARPNVPSLSSPGLVDILEQLSHPGRVMALAQQLDVQLRPRRGIAGRHGFYVETPAMNSVKIGSASLTSYHASCLTPDLDRHGVFRATCVALSVGYRVNDLELPSEDESASENGEELEREDTPKDTKTIASQSQWNIGPRPILLVMVITREGSGCYRRLGLGQVDILRWAKAGPNLKPVILE